MGSVEHHVCLVLPHLGCFFARHYDRDVCILWTFNALIENRFFF